MTLTGTYELTRLESWLAGLLRPAVAPLIGTRIYPAVAPDELPPAAADELASSYVVFSLLTAGDDYRAVGGPDARLVGSSEWTIKAVGSTPATPPRLAELAELVDQAIDGATGIVDGLSVTAHRSRPVYYPEPIAGRLWWHVGAVYDLTVS